MMLKRNIFESSARMPGSYEAVAVPMAPSDTTRIPMRVVKEIDASVRHAPTPRIGEQK